AWAGGAYRQNEPGPQHGGQKAKTPTNVSQRKEARRCERRAPRSRRKMSSPAKVPEAKPTSNHPAEEAQWKHVRAHIAKGNKATEKAEQHYVAAAQYLKGLKVAHDARGGTWEQWEITVKAKAGIGAPRASEIMQLGDGRKTLTGLRLSGAQREKRRRERNRISSSRDEEDGAPAAVPVAMAEPEPEHPADIIDQCVAG